jgi:hypothetical protein
MKRPGAKTLKKKFLECFGMRRTSATALHGVVKWLVEQGYSRKTLVALAVQANYPKKDVSSVLSRIFCALGLRERQPGAGRKPSPDALELLAYARVRYGKHYLRVLRAAGWAGYAQTTPPDCESGAQSASEMGLIVVHNSSACQTLAPPRVNGPGNPARGQKPSAKSPGGSISKGTSTTTIKTRSVTRGKLP